ncbi:MAG: hypothetical protein RLZZ142_199 [Verrucomicrobiota bacterium]
MARRFYPFLMSDLSTASSNAPQVSFERRLGLLKALPSFDGLDANVLAELANVMGTEFFADGQDIVHESCFGDRLYLIESGVVGVYAEGPTGELMLGKLGEGERFGDVDLLTSTRRRRATVRSLTPVTVLTLRAQEYERLVALYPEVKGDLACAASAFMQKRLEALMHAQAEKMSGISKSPLGF